jgi:hypothetical protein
LTQLMQEETEAVSGMRASRLEGLLAEKRSATHEYETLMRELSQEPDAVRNLAAPRKAEIRTAAERLAAETRANARALKAALEAHHRLMESIAAAVRSAQSAGEHYLADGRATGRPRAGAPLAISLNQVL